MQKNLHNVFIAVLLVLYSTSSASVNPNQIIKKGTKLIYDVNYLGSQYEFTIVIKDQSETYRFDWSMSAPLNKKGTLNISKEAIQNATELFNYFSNGDVNPANQCCVILSKKMFNTFQKNSSLEICTDKKKNEISIFGNPYDHTQSFGYNNDFSNEFDCKTVTNGDEYQITYVNDSNFPLIIEMNLGWTLKLKNISN